MGNFELIKHIWSMPFGPYFLGIGLVGQVLFFSRFFVQWIVSERRKESVIPLSFWYFGLFGSVMILIYGLYIREPVLVLGQIFNPIIYMRNLVLIKRKQDSSGTRVETEK
jgi:lipid-A-disaccharide synthase-like uncharacterized protein